MDENTNQQSTTPLGNERRDNPGQTKIIENANGDSITPGMPAWTDDTPLEDIAKQYTGIGGKYNDLVENAADNVGDRQVQLVGNDFGATNPYMFNTYYEPAATSFASEMRKQGTQRAVEVGLDRAEKEARKNAEDAQKRYNNAVAAAKAREEQRRKAQMHISETDMSKLPEGVTEQEILNYYKTGKMSEKDVRDKYTAAGTKQIQDKTNVNINWHALDKKGNNMRLPVSADTKSHFGITNEQWANMSKKERDAFWAREDVGNYWTRLYMVNYFKEFYGEKAGSNMAKSFNDLNERVDNVVRAVKSNDLDSLKTIDVDFAGVQINFTPDQEVEKIKKAIQETDKLSDSEKQKYIKTIEAKRLSSGGPGAFMQMWHEIESKQVRMENNRQLETWDPDHKWLKNGMQVDTTTYDDVWEIMKLFAETEENMGMSIGGEKSGILHYADVEPDSKQVYSHTSGTLMDTADKKQLDNMTTEVFGINVDSWKKMAKLESERPEDYEFLRDHASFVMAGGAGSFEQVEDGDKKYFINGKYWSANDENSPISVGDFIFHTIDGTVNSEGEYSDPQLKEFISDYKKIYNGDLEASEENIKKLEANYNAYANRVARAMFLSNNYGTSVNENLYNVILALDGVSDDKLEFVNPSNPNEKMSVASIKDWFNSLSDDAKYNAYTTISRKARESRGVMILSDDKTGQLYDAGITQNGKSTIGKYNEKDSSSNMRVANQLEKLSNEDCLALAFYIDNGIKNGTISNSFMDNEGVDLSDSFFNGIYNGLKGAAQFFGSVAALGVGSLMPKDKEGLNDVMRWGGEVWNDMTTMSESDDWMHWSGQSAMNPYTQQVREQQRGNLNHMIDTTFNLDYFNVENTVDPNTGEVKDKNGNVVSLDNTHYNHMDQGKAFFTGAAGMGGAIAEFVLETAATSGMGKLLKVGAKGTSSLIRKGARAVATKSPAAASVIRASSKFVKTTAKFFTTPVSRTAIQSALQASHAASYLDDVARQYSDDLVKGIADGEIKTAKDVINTVGKTTKAANAVKGSADDVARATLKEAEKTAVDGLKNYADDAIEAVKKGETMVDDLARGAAEQADDVSRKLTKKEAQTLLDNVKKSVSKIQNDYAIRYGLDVVADNVDDAARSLSQRILDKLDKALTNAHVFKGVNDSVRTLLKDNLVDAVSRAAVNGRLAAKTGMSVSRIANLSDDAASVLYGMLRASESSADDVAQYALRGVSRMQSVSADVVLKNVDFKKAAQKIVEASERLAVKGGELGLDDVFRLIATEGSVNPGDLLKVLKRSDFVKDRITDWSRDIAQNYWTPELDEHFESHYVDFDTYLHSPEQWLWGAGFDLGITGLTRLKNHGKLKFYESRIDKILGDVDLSTANKADRAKFRKQMVKLDNLRAKASKLNGKILDRKVSFEQVHDVADKAERAIKDQVDLMSSHIDITETADLIKMHSDEAIDEAKAVLAKGGFGSKRKYKQILADADQFNRMIVRGNDKLAMVQEASQALQQVSITRYLDIDTHSKTIHKLNGQQWGKTMSLAWKDITAENFAAKYGGILGLREDALGKAFDSRYTINFKDPAKTKAAYAAGQTLVYDTIFKKVRKVMGNSLTKSEYADLRIELNSIRDRMIAAGNQMIDDGRKVRWNYMPTQALTWESEPGSMSAVRALWGWDYKGGIHMTPAGEIANPLLARDQWDFSNIINDFDNGQNTFKRKKGDREIELERVKNPGATIDEFKDVNYNWAGFDPAYACNAYLNSIDSARIIQPLLDPINGIVIKSPEMAKKVLHTSNVVLDNELVAIEKKYKERVDKEISKRSKAKAGRTSKASLERRATLITDLSGKEGIEKFAKPDVGNKVSAAQAKIDKATMQIRDKVYNSPAISALESMYSSRPELEGLSPEARKAYVVGKLNIAYTELGNDIAAVRSMYTDGGKIKKAYLDSDGNVKPQYTDVMGNLVPDAGTSGTYSNTYGTQYRTFVNQLAQNKSIKAEAFADNNARNIRFSDGSSINANAFEKHIYNVLATKQAIDLGARVDYFRTKLSPKEMTQLSISKRLQPIDLDSDNARYTLTKEARNILSTFYGDWDNYTNSYTIKNGSAKDKFFQNAISNAFDEAEANGGEINTYDFVQLVDKHIPDFIKDAGRNNDVNVKDFFESMSLLRTYENSGGTTESLLRDLDNALYAEKSAANPDAGKIKALSDTIAVINGTYDFDQRTINRASFNESLDFEIDESDFGDDSKLTVGDVTADANTSGQVEGFSNLYIPKGVDENLIGGTNESAPEVGLEAYPNMKNASGQSAGTFEASTAGHKEFSALNAKFAPGTKIMGIDIGGRTIEDVYQKTLKGSGKNQAPAADSVLGKATADAEKKAGKALTKAEKEAISQRYYDRLWDIWGEQNPELKAQIENLPAGTKITDKFAKTGVSQANSLQRWVKPAQGQADLATIKFSHLDDKRPDELRVVLMDDSKTVNKAKSTDGNILHTMARNKGDGTIEFHPKKFMEHYENVKSGKSGWNTFIDKKAKEAGSANVDTPWSGKKMEWKDGTAKAREFISENSPIDLSNEYGSKDSLATWLQEGRSEAYNGGDADEGVLKRWNSLPKEVKDKISEDPNFSRLWDHYSPAGAMMHLGVDFVYLPDTIDRIYADYLWKNSKGAGVADDAFRKAKDVVTEVSKSPEDMLTWTLLHERGHDAPGGYGANLKYSGEGGKEAAANNWAYEKFFDKTSPDYIAAHDAAVKILNSINTKPVKSGRMDFSYGKSAQPHISEKTTFEAVKSGKRTSTTRLASQHADYWQDLKVGDIVEFKNKGNTDSVLVRVTKAPEWIDPTKMSDAELKSLLQKEGWKQKAFDELITNKVKAGDKALQFEYELVNKPTQSTTVFAPRNIGTSIKNALDILHANTESDYGSRQAARNTKRDAFDSLKKEFDAIANKLDKAADGNKIYRGNDILLGASDNQYLAFANGDHNTPWLGNENPGGVDNYTARQALIAGRDRSGGRSFGNIDFWTPEKIDDFIKKNGITVDPQLQEQLDNYKVSYAEKSAIVNDPSSRGRVSDAKLSLQNSVPEYLASFNSTVDVDGNTKQAKSSFDLNQRSKYKSDSLNYHSEGERYKLGDQRVVREANKASQQLSSQIFSANDAIYGGLDDPNTLYDWEGTETVAAVNAEIDAAGDEVIEAALQKDKEYQELLAWRNKEASNKKVDKNKIKEIDEFIAARRNEVIKTVDDDVQYARESAMDDIENRGEKVEFTPDGTMPVKSSRKDKSAPTSLDDYEYDNGDVAPIFTARDEGVNNTPYISFLNASKNYNISESLVDLNTEFYGNGDKDGFIDARNKLNKQLDDEMASVAMMFDTDVSAKITALKELDGAKDGEVADILKKAKQQANDIEDETVRKYVIKRLDDEIKFAEDNLKLTEKTKAKVAKAIAERDPEYRAALEAKRQSNMKPTGSQISAAVPNGSNPVFVNGNLTPDGHITLQQLVDARNEMKLSRKNGKNTLKSSAETKKVLNAMRKEMEYNGSTLITEGPARRQDTWILNLYKRVYDSAGAPLPKVPTFEDLENGFMEYKGKKIKLDLKLSEIYIDPKIASLGHTYWGEGNVGLIEKFYKAATAVSSFNKTIQDIQLAGGLGQYNAFTLRNAITMMWQDPIGGTRALFTNFRNARSNESVVQFYLKNHEKLLKMAIDTGDYSAINAFTNVINARDEVTGGSAIAELGHTIMDMPENIKKEGVIAGLWDTTSNTYKAIFNNPTFVRWAAIAKADMQLRNYDHATRFVNRIMAQYGLKDEDFANMEGGMGTKDKYIAHLAQMRTDRYWTPSKFVTSGGNADKYLQKQKRLSIQRTADSLRGMPQKKTLRQCLSDFFFAIGYKLQMNAHPLVGIGSIFTALPNNLRASNAIRKRTSFSVMTSRFAGRGDRNEALVMIGIAALAHAWNTHIGAPSAFEELFGDHGDDENGTHGIAQSLMNFQDFGKFWMPNTKDGRFDPTQRGASVDPFFSIFTLQNSAMRAANKAFFPNQIPINTQRVFYQEDNQNFISRMQGVSDELIGANLLSGYKAIYEFLNNSTYFGNNIWERKRLPDGSENPNYNPLRNLMASVAHIMNLEEVMLGDTTNRWVKGLDIDTKTWKDGEQVDPYSVGPKIGEAGKYNGRTGTVAGSGIIQHEYLSALKKANDGEYFDALTESMELPFKTRNYASRARTQLNTEVIAALRNAKKEYDNKVKSASPEEKDKAYAEFAKKAVNIMHDWSAKNGYALGPNDELTSAATKILVSFMADEYDDVTNRVQNRYDKIKQELKMADGDQFLFSKEAMEAAIADGMSDSEAAELHNKHLTALKEAQIKEYKARQALIEAKIDPNVFDTVDYINDNASAKSASFDKKTYAEILGKLEAPIGEFKNYKEMKAYYEARISEATTTKQKAKLANMYNEQVLDVITPYIEAGYGAAAFNNIYWDGDNLSNKLGPYIILPADKYYGGKYPRTNYLKDMLGIGYRDSRNLPSDKQVEEQLHKVAVSLSKGNISSASALVDNALVQLRKGYWHAAPADYDKLIRMRALLSSRSK